MAKSKETFSKKEKEKKKVQKRQEKREKKEDRQANARNGNNLNEMIAYIDEYGNLSEVPPDPKNKIVIKAEDIPVGIVRPDEVPEEITRTGVVTMFNEQKGYGFIQDSVNKESVFIHINALETRIQQNDKVTFETENGPKGKNAIKVKKI